MRQVSHFSNVKTQLSFNKGLINSLTKSPFINSADELHEDNLHLQTSIKIKPNPLNIFIQASTNLQKYTQADKVYKHMQKHSSKFKIL
jgi:hypothetical protein